MQLPGFLKAFMARLSAWAGVIFSLGALAALVIFFVLSPSTDWRQLAVAIGLALSVEVVKTVRWRGLLGAPFAILPRLLTLVFGSRLLNALAPLRAGDVWRVAGARAERSPLVIAGGSVVVEKILDGAAL